MTPQRLDRCSNCRNRVLWVTRVRPGQPDKRVCLDPTPVDTSGHQVVGTVAVVSGHAYSPTDLAERVMASRCIALDEAHTIVRRDFPHHHYHRCLEDRP